MRVNVPNLPDNPLPSPSGLATNTGQMASDVAGKIVETGQSLLETTGKLLTEGVASENLKEIGPQLEKITAVYRNLIGGAVTSIRELNKVDLDLGTNEIGKIMTDIANGLVKVEETYGSKSSLAPVKGTVDITLTLKALPGGPGVEAKLHLDLERIEKKTGVIVNP